MLTYILRRLALMVPTLIGVTAVVFFVMALAPDSILGASLNEEGAQAQGEEVRRAQKLAERRYGLHLSKPVQYLRWLNRISPVGFRMASDLKDRDPQATKAIKAELTAQLPEFTTTERWTESQIDRLLDAVLDYSAYRGDPPQVTLNEVVGALNDPQGAGLLLIGSLSDDVELTKQDIEETAERSARAQRRAWRSGFIFEVGGLDRVRFDHPAIKWPDLGESRKSRKVHAMLLETVPVTILLSLITIPIVYLVAIVSGTLMARYRGQGFDVLTGTLFLGLWSFPVIGAGTLMIVYLANVDQLYWFPASGLVSPEGRAMPMLPSWSESGFVRGYLLDVCWHLVLPIVCLTYGGFAVLAKLQRGAILDNLQQDYARTARAKGVNERGVLFGHVMRNSLLPLITVAAAIIPSLFVGSVIVENIFSIQGMGKLAVEAAFEKDRDLIMGTTLLGGLLGLGSELLRDILYAVADPRVSYD